MMPSEPARELSHTDRQGRARMVDVSPKPETVRTATAEVHVRMQPATLALVRDNRLKKGDVLAVARLAGIQAAKQTATLIPLCHPLRLTNVALDVQLAPPDAIVLSARVRAVDRTGVEMEALTACAVAALTVYDMVKAVDRGVVIGPLRLLEKTGGKSGDFRALDLPPSPPAPTQAATPAASGEAEATPNPHA